MRFFKHALYTTLLLASTGLMSLSAAANVVILQYHHVSETTPRVTSVTPEELRQHMRYLTENDFKVIPLTQAVDAFQNDNADSLPDKAVVITFDDGYQNVFDYAAPILKEFNLPYTVFVNPRLLANHDFYMGWDELRQLQQQGALIVNHSQSHQHLIRRLADENEQQWQQRVSDDISSAQQAIDDALGQQPKYFAYPYGEYSPALETLLQEMGYVAFGQHSGPWGKYTPLTAIPRFPASGRYASLDTLKTKLLSLAMPVTEVKPEQSLLAPDQVKPELQVTLANSDDMRNSQLQCFAGAEVLAPTWLSATQFTVKPREALGIGRSRYNCTAPSESQAGRYYWYSKPFIRTDSKGNWPD